MTPQEIAQLKQQSPALQDALKEHREAWAFLRDQVTTRPKPYRYYLEFPVPEFSSEWFDKCEQCQKTVFPLLKSPYNASHPGWCVECVLDGFFTDAPIYKSPEEIGREREADRWNIYCPPPWELPDWPADYDGPSIEWS